MTSFQIILHGDLLMKAMYLLILRIHLQRLFQRNTIFNDLIENMIIDFVAIKVGDVNGSATTNQLFARGDSREGLEDLVFQVADRQLQANETYTVDFKAKDFTNVLGYQFSLDYDATQLEIVNYTSCLLYTSPSPRD